MMTYRPRGGRGMPRQGPPRDLEPQMSGPPPPPPPPRRDYDPYSPIRPPPRRRPNYDDELISKTLHVDQKRFYIDLKENRFGKFIKIIESNHNRGLGRNRVIVPQELFQEFTEVLTQYVEVLEKSDSQEAGENGPADSSERIQTQKITNERKTLYVDLRKNSRGKFLKVTEQSPRTGGEDRTQVIVPSEGLEVLRDVIGDILRVASPPQQRREQPRDPRGDRDPRDVRDPRDRKDQRDPREQREREPRFRRGEGREFREPPREREHERREPREPREHRGDKEPRERNRRPRREVENMNPMPPATETAEGGETEVKQKPAENNPTANPGNNEETESSSVDETLPATIEVRSERKRFYFDARRNEMGVFLQVSEVGEVTRRRRRHINIPHVSWQSCHRALETMLEQLPYEPPDADVPVPIEETEPLLENGKPDSPPQIVVPGKPEDSKTESS